MEPDVKLTKLASCAGCGAKVGAGTLVKMLDGFRTHTDPRLIVGYDKSDDASVYVVSDDTAIVQTTDFFPPIVDDPFLYGQIAATNALSDVYAMGGEPKLALNIMCLADSMDDKIVREILRGGYDKAYEAGAIITGGHTIHGAEPIYGLAVTGFVHPKRVLTNSGARPGDVLILTKPLGVGILTTAAKADLVKPETMNAIYKQMATLNKTARDIMLRFTVHSCTDVTGFSLMHRAGDADRAREVLLCLRGEAPCRHDHRAVAALHVGRAPAVDLPVRNLAAERVVRPLGRINHVHGVHVPVEQNRFAGPFSVNGSDDVSEPVKDYLVKAECEHSLPHQLRHGLFLTGNARGLERSLAKGDQRFICIHAMAPFCLTKKASPRRGSPIFYSSFFFKYATVSFRHPRIARSQCSRIRSLARGAFSARSASTIPVCCAAEASRIAGRWK